MCGFVGILTPRTATQISHRGPDGTGAHIESLPWCHLSLEMARLAIVDRSPIKMPFDFRASCGVVLAFNGEIFNWRSLRAELSDGSPWQTNCDAEVVARAWRKWGPDMLQRFNGMFGLILSDEQTNTVFLARDRAGEKPLYYATLGSGIAFASEIKALPIYLEEASCLELETLEFDCLETTSFRGVRCLGPGEYLLFKNPHDLRAPKPLRWWSLPSSVDESANWLATVDETESLLVDAIKLRSTCEVPVAVQLSGGLDSSVIQAVIQSERLYTVTFPDDGINNLDLASKAAGGREPVAVSFSLEDLEQAMTKIAYYLDTPATWTACAQWFMNKEIAEDGAVVVISGEGADELFGGYTRYRYLWHVEQLGKDPNLSAYAPLQEALFGSNEELLARLLNRGGPTTLDHARELVKRFDIDGDMCQRMARIDFHVTLPVLLRMADRMSAAFSLENRSPFLDYRLMELSARIPTRWKINAQESKAVLREVARRLGVSPAIVDAKEKRGLFIPWKNWHNTANIRDRSGFAKMMRESWRKAFAL